MRVFDRSLYKLTDFLIIGLLRALEKEKKGEFMAQSLAHTKWLCEYNIVKSHKTAIPAVWYN